MPSMLVPALPFVPVPNGPFVPVPNGPFVPLWFVLFYNYFFAGL